VRALKESWKEAPQAIEELEKEGEVLVTRTVKDGQLRMVFWNEIKPAEEEGGMLVEKGTLCTFRVIGGPGFSSGTNRSIALKLTASFAQCTFG
jgi:hypothetical protein